MRTPQYNMHVALAFYETKEERLSRNDRIRKVLTTMGASIFVGGATTMTSALPLGFTASLAFQTFFYTFLAIPILGVAHGLILLPVILSLWGPHSDRVAGEIFSFPTKIPESQPSSSTGTSPETGPEYTVSEVSAQMVPRLSNIEPSSEFLNTEKGDPEVFI